MLCFLVSSWYSSSPGGIANDRLLADNAIWVMPIVAGPVGLVKWGRLEISLMARVVLPEETAKSITEAVRKLRKAIGESQQEFAYRMKTAIRTIARYETV